jgi:hypothetical protein
LLRLNAPGADFPSMLVESNKRVTKITRGTDDLSLSSVVGAKRPGVPQAFGGAVPGREGVVRARLSHLLASLGDLPAQQPSFDRGPGFGGLLDEICPAGSVVIHGRRVPNKALSLEHLAIVPRGLVVVGSDLGHTLPVGFAPITSDWQSRQGSGGPALAAGGRFAERPAERRSGLVRDILRRGNGLHAWLSQTPWRHVPVFVAACSAPQVGPVQKAPLVLEGMRIGGLWLGAVNQLPEWLASDGRLDPEARAALGNFLAGELPVG